MHISVSPLVRIGKQHTGSNAIISAKGVIDGRILITYGEVGASLQAIVVRYLGRIPSSEA